MAAMKLRIVRPVARACALLALTLAAGCSGGARSAGAPPAPVAAAKDASVSFALTTERTAHALPSVGGFGGHVTLRTSVPVAGATLRVASSTQAPAQAALAKRIKRLQTGTLAVLFYATFTPSVTVTLAELPSFSVDLPGNVPTADRQFFYGISDPSVSNAVVAFRTEGPAAVAGSTLAFDGSPTPLTLDAGQSYIFVFYATTNAATADRGQTEQLAPGVSYTHVERPAAAAPSYAVDAGFRTTLAAAQSLAAAYAPAGYSPRIVPIAQRPTDLPGTGSFGYLVRVSEYSVVDDANAVATKLKAAGLTASIAATNLDGLTPTGGPLVINILTIDPGQFRGTLTPALATGMVKGLDRTSNIAARANAIAAVNGGYFVIGEADGTPGDAAGISVIDGELISEAVNGRTSLLVRPDGRASIDALTTRDTETSSDGASAPLTGLNRNSGTSAAAAAMRARYRPLRPSTTSRARAPTISCSSRRNSARRPMRARGTKLSSMRRTTSPPRARRAAVRFPATVRSSRPSAPHRTGCARTRRSAPNSRRTRTSWVKRARSISTTTSVSSTAVRASCARVASTSTARPRASNTRPRWTAISTTASGSAAIRARSPASPRTAVSSS